MLTNPSPPWTDLFRAYRFFNMYDVGVEPWTTPRNIRRIPSLTAPALMVPTTSLVRPNLPWRPRRPHDNFCKSLDNTSEDGCACVPKPEVLDSLKAKTAVAAVVAGGAVDD